MGLLDALFSGNSGGGLLDFLQNNALNQQMPSGLPSDQAQYGQPPMQAMGQMQPQMFAANQPPRANAQPPIPQQPPPVISAPPTQPMQSLDTGPPFGDRLMAGLQGFAHGGGGLLPALANGISGLATGQRSDPLGIAQQNQNLTLRALIQRGVDPVTAQAAIANPELLKQVVSQAYASPSYSSAGNGYVLNSKTGKATREFEPEDKTPTSVLEYKFYKDNLPKGEAPMPYDVWSTAKSRAGATNISNNIDMNSGQTYDKQLAEGLGKSHATLANGVEDAQTRARDIAAMQGAVDAIQKNGGTTGGLGQTQVLDLKKTINAGLSGLGIDKPFNESDLADKEFLTKFNRSMAGAQAKGAVGARVTNFEMNNFLKANPGLDMSLTGNQRLLGIQSQIEERNIAVGNAIRDATASAISSGKKIDPVTVQKIIADYDGQHHIKDVVTGQDLTQSYALPEFQQGDSNASMAKAHSENLKAMEKTIGGKTYVQRDGQWYPK